MSYIPAQQPTVDPAGVADLFSEYLINPYGRWYAVEPSFQHLALDGINKLVRNFSLHVYRGDEGWQKGQPLGTDAIYFSFDSPVNMTYMEKVSLLFHMYDRFYGNETWTEPILTGDLIISLTDINQLAIYSPFYQKNTNLQPWNDTLPYDRTPVETAKSQFTGTALPQFDWTKVVAITIYVGTNAIPWYDPLPIAIALTTRGIVKSPPPPPKIAVKVVVPAPTETTLGAVVPSLQWRKSGSVIFTV